MCVLLHARNSSSSIEEKLLLKKNYLSLFVYLSA